MVGMDINQQSILGYFNVNRLQGLLEIMKENPNGKEKAHLKDIYISKYITRKSNKKVTGINNNTKLHTIIFINERSKPLIQQHFTI